MLHTLRITISDNADTEFTRRLEGKPRSPSIEMLISRHLDATLDIVPDERHLTIDASALTALEDILGGGSLLSDTDLLTKVQRLAGVSFLHVRLPFTHSQLEQLSEKAARNSLTVDQLVERTAPRIYEQFFDLIARSH